MVLPKYRKSARTLCALYKIKNLKSWLKNDLFSQFKTISISISLHFATKFQNISMTHVYRKCNNMHLIKNNISLAREEHLSGFPGFSAWDLFVSWLSHSFLLPAVIWFFYFPPWHRMKCVISFIMMLPLGNLIPEDGGGETIF